MPKPLDLIANTPCVYFISDGQGHCKIGVASNIVHRLSTLQVSSAFDLTPIHIVYTDSMADAYELEKQYHADLQSSAIRGEWFNEESVSRLLAGDPVKDEKAYMCDVCPEFRFDDALRLYMICLESKSEDEFLLRYEEEMPDYWKEYDRKRMNIIKQSEEADDDA